jgi:hypothetical protein
MTSTNAEHHDHEYGGAEAMLDRLLMSEHGRDDAEREAWPAGQDAGAVRGTPVGREEQEEGGPVRRPVSE